ncbi:MAG: DUF6064 family protein [Marinobacter sp.]|uniref:DUF6064 family protein n=1 Tax=Marinobacter sp. TaxID=50741 RepID=UPI0034A01C56
MDWSSYSLADFLMFGPDVFLRLYVRTNQDIWPWPLLAVVLSVVLAWLLTQRQAWAKRAVLALLGVAWAWSGAVFMLQYYGPINSPVVYFGWGFIAQGALLGLIAPTWRPMSYRRIRGWDWRIALVWLATVAALPWLVVMESGEWRALALFAITPDLTVLASLPCLLMLPRKLRGFLLFLPALWAIFSALTLWTLGMTTLMIIPLAALVLMPFAIFLNRR